MPANSPLIQAAWAVVSNLLGRSRPHTGRLDIHPVYHGVFQKLGLTTPEAFLALSGPIVSGHANRHVIRVELPVNDVTLVAYLKREHRVSAMDRLAAWLDGFGFVSKSLREGWLVRTCNRLGMPAAEWLASGETADGRAFLLLRRVENRVNLRQLLHRLPTNATQRRLRLVRHLGRVLARLHRAGFDHPEVSAKHWLVNNDGSDAVLLDWPRGKVGTVSWRSRVRALALLNATISPECLSDRERLVGFLSYVRNLRLRAERQRLLRAVLCRTEQLRRRRSIREQWLPPGMPQPLLWLDGEKMCVAPESQAIFTDVMREFVYADSFTGTETIRLADGQLAQLSRHKAGRVRATWRSAEVRQAALLLTLQRYGIACPKLIGFGQDPSVGRAFLMVQVPESACPLSGVMSPETLQSLGTLLRQLHQAGATVRSAAALAQLEDGSVMLADVAQVERGRFVPQTRMRRLAAELGLTADELRQVQLGFDVAAE